ncbi:UNVERIFIED_CONTAM: hypothetical protein K2H54_020002 [Gekko kuhli]
MPTLKGKEGEGGRPGWAINDQAQQSDRGRLIPGPGLAPTRCLLPAAWVFLLHAEEKLLEPKKATCKRGCEALGEKDGLTKKLGDPPNYYFEGFP